MTTKGEADYAIRRAVNLFDEWNNTTGFVPKFTDYYYEMQGLIEDAVHCGIQCALKIEEPLPSQRVEENPQQMTDTTKPNDRETEAWLIVWSDEYGCEQKKVYQHNTIADYRSIYPNAVVFELIRRTDA